jgi:hypothetical protein
MVGMLNEHFIFHNIIIVSNIGMAKQLNLEILGKNFIAKNLHLIELNDRESRLIKPGSTHDVQ